MSLPSKEFLAQAEIVNSDSGITQRDLIKAVNAGVIERHLFPGRKRGKYRRSEIIKAFRLNGKNETI